MEQKIRQLIKENMLAKNKNATTTYKNILETAQKIAKQTNVAVSDDMIIAAVKKEVKQLNDLLGYVEKGSDKYSEIMDKLSYCESALPKMVTPEEILTFLCTENLEKNMGVCMKALKAKFGANMDGKVASMVVKSYVDNSDYER